jgi:hypothetical protein
MIIGSKDPKYNIDDIDAQNLGGSLHWELQMVGSSIGPSKDYET